MARPHPSSKAEQSAETSGRLIAVASEQFAKHGYALASTETIVQLAGVTRGALYHHFGSKEGLFKAVVNQVQRDVAQQVAMASEESTDAWEQLINGCQMFLQASIEPGVQRILLVDGPAVIGWDAWRKMDSENSMLLLEEGLNELANQGILSIHSVRAATHLLSGAMNEAVLWIAHADQPQRALEETSQTLRQILEGLRKR